MAVWVALFLRTTFRLMQTTETFDVEGCFSSGKMAFHAPKIRYMLIYKEETMPTWNEMPFKANACVRLDFGAWRRLGNSGILNMFRHFAQEISAAILLPVYEWRLWVCRSRNFIHFMREMYQLPSPERIQSEIVAEKSVCHRNGFKINFLAPSSSHHQHRYRPTVRRAHISFFPLLSSQ